MKRIICLAMASAFASGSVWAESHRLAFSKSEQIEIFVEHAAGASWCSPQLAMRVVYLAEPNPSALATLMPKLGALLDQQCPVATAVNWASANAQGNAIAHGTSSKTANWALITTPANVAKAKAETEVETSTSAVAVAPVVVAPVATQNPPASPAAPQITTELSKATAPVPAPATAPATLSPPVVNNAAPAVPAEAKPEQESIAVAPTVAAVAQPAAPTQTPAASDVVAVAAALTPAPAPNPTPAAAPVPAPTPAPADFTVNGWKPQRDSDVRTQAKFLTTMQDQNGCQILSRFDLGDGAQYLSLKSEGLSCAPGGLATGKGRLMLERSDGATIARTNNVWLASGIPFTKEVTDASLAATDGKSRLWLNLGHDVPSQSYFLLRASVSNYNGIGVWHIDPRIDAVTANEAVFRQADQLKGVVLSGLTALQNSAMPWAGSSRLVFADNFENGIVKEEHNHLLYAIQASRQTDWRTDRAKGEWQLDLRRGTNYLFQRDERLAQQKRMQEQQEARLRQAKLMENANRERSKLATYESLMLNSKADPQKVLADLQNDVGYSHYNRLVAGKKAPITRIVRVKGSDGDDAKVDWPYDIRLVGQKALKNQWYMVKGEVTLDGKRLDGESLPLTLVTTSQERIMPCAKDGCLDMANPLTLARLQFSDPQWTPEAARLVIEQANQP